MQSGVLAKHRCSFRAVGQTQVLNLAAQHNGDVEISALGHDVTTSLTWLCDVFAKTSLEPTLRILTTHIALVPHSKFSKAISPSNPPEHEANSTSEDVFLLATDPTLLSSGHCTNLCTPPRDHCCFMGQL